MLSLVLYRASGCGQRADCPRATNMPHATGALLQAHACTHGHAPAEERQPSRRVTRSFCRYQSRRSLDCPGLSRPQGIINITFSYGLVVKSTALSVSGEQTEYHDPKDHDYGGQCPHAALGGHRAARQLRSQEQHCQHCWLVAWPAAGRSKSHSECPRRAMKQKNRTHIRSP